MTCVELQVEGRRLWCCLSADVLPGHAAMMVNVDAPCASALSFDGATGVAFIEIELKTSCIALKATCGLFWRLRPLLRAIVLDIVGFSQLRIPACALERMDRALIALRALGVPIACSADGSNSGIGMSVWSAADYCVANAQAIHHEAIGERGAHARRECAYHFAASLAHRAAIGLSHMLRLMRPRRHGARSMETAAGMILPHDTVT